MFIDPYKYEGHQWVAHRDIGKAVCADCGLVALRNEATERAVRWGCNWRDHPTYLRELRARIGR